MLEVGQEWILHITPFRLKETTKPTNPEIPTNTLALYAKDKAGVSALYFLDDALVEHDLSLVPAAAAALTRVNDTNVTLTLCGSPSSALLAATSLTLGWTGQLSGARGGTSFSTWNLGDSMFGAGGTTLLQLAGNITTQRKFLRQTGTGAASQVPVWAGIQPGDIGGLSNSGPPIDGLDGQDGQDGFPGPIGPIGATGATGSTGATGATGPAGSSGVNGIFIYEPDEPIEPLMIPGPQGPAGSGNHTILDGSVHSDSVVQTVSRGSLIYGNGIPKWDELVLGPAGAFLRNDGTDAMWSTLILPNAITANNIVYGSATNTYGQSTNLAFDGTDFLLGSGIRARMVGQNRFRHLNAGVKAYHSANVTGLAVNTVNTASFDSEENDTDGLHEGVTNPSRITTSLTGWWLFMLSIPLDMTNCVAPTQAAAWMYKNGSTTIVYAFAAQSPGFSAVVGPVSLALIYMTATDYMQVVHRVQASSGTYDTNAAAHQVAFQGIYLGE